MAKKSTALVKWDEKLAAKAKAQAAVEVLGNGNRFSIQGGKLSFKKVNIPENKINVIIVDSIFENALYEGTYNPASPDIPICFAYGDDEKTIVPHEKSRKMQNKAGCATCPHNEWASAKTGKGKACKNNRKLILLPADSDDIESAELGVLSVPPTSLKAWKGYVHQLNNTLNRPAMSVVTEISVAIENTYPVLGFRLVEKLEDGDVLEAIEKREEEARKILTQPYTPIERTEVKTKKQLKARKFV